MSEEFQYDVFLSHNSKNKAQAPPQAVKALGALAQMLSGLSVELRVCVRVRAGF
jgi:hypothetical protein